MQDIYQKIQTSTKENINEIKLGILLSTAFTRYTNHLNNILKEMNISLSQTRILLTLAHKDGVSIDHLSQKTGIGKSSITKSVKILERKEFITKEIDPQDNRKKIIKITNKGRKIQEKALEINQEIEETIEKQIGKQETNNLKYNLKTLITLMEK